MAIRGTSSKEGKKGRNKWERVNDLNYTSWLYSYVECERLTLCSWIVWFNLCECVFVVTYMDEIFTYHQKLQLLC